MKELKEMRTRNFCLFMTWMRMEDGIAFQSSLAKYENARLQSESVTCDDNYNR